MIQPSINLEHYSFSLTTLDTLTLLYPVAPVYYASLQAHLPWCSEQSGKILCQCRAVPCGLAPVWWFSFFCFPHHCARQKGCSRQCRLALSSRNLLMPDPFCVAGEGGSRIQLTHACALFQPHTMEQWAGWAAGSGRGAALRQESKRVG